MLQCPDDNRKTKIFYSDFIHNHSLVSVALFERSASVGGNAASKVSPHAGLGKCRALRALERAGSFAPLMLTHIIFNARLRRLHADAQLIRSIAIPFCVTNLSISILMRQQPLNRAKLSALAEAAAPPTLSRSVSDDTCRAPSRATLSSARRARHSTRRPAVQTGYPCPKWRPL